MVQVDKPTLEKGTTVIVRSNEDAPFKVGTFQEISDIGLPLVEIDGEVRLCFCIVVPYTDELAAFLSSMSNTRQWDILRDIIVMHDTLRHELDQARQRRQSVSKV